MFESEKLEYWLLACSDTDEQYWINTCECATRNQAKIFHLPTIAHIIYLSRILLNEISLSKLSSFDHKKSYARSLWFFTLPSQHSFAQYHLKLFRNSLDQLASKGFLF